MKEDSGLLVDVGKHPRVCALLGGIANERPPKPRYFETWDVSIVLKMLKAWGQNEVLDLKQLSLKLTMLLALTSLHKGMELHILNTVPETWDSFQIGLNSSSGKF